MTWTDPTTGTTYCCPDGHAIVPTTVPVLPGTVAATYTLPEVAWLVEFERLGRTGWWTGRTMDGHGAEWTDDPDEAIRFSRREDAQRVIDRHPIRPATATEHVWIGR